MGDSDDEYDRKRRDKFRGERSTATEGYRERRERGGGAGRDDWSERNPFRSGGGGGASAGGGGRPRDYRARDRYSYSSPGRDLPRDLPPAKRMRPDWGDDMRGAMPRYGYDPYIMHAWNEHYAHSLHSAYAHAGGAGAGHGGHVRETATGADLLTQPPMMTLKQFLDTQDDGISDAEVLRKYSEYKLEFKRQQLNEFFVAHKDEEWFKNKYHPVDSVNRKEEQLSFLKKRVEVFNELLQNGNIKSVTVDTSQTEPLLRLLDTAVIKLEGGTDDDLKILDEKPREPIISFSSERTFQPKIPEQDDDVIITSVEKKVSDPEPKEDEDDAVMASRKALQRQADSDDEENWDIPDENDASTKPLTPKKETSNNDDEDDDGATSNNRREKKSLKRKRTDSDSSSSSSNNSDSSSSSSSDDDDADNGKLDKYNVEDVKDNSKKDQSDNEENIKENKLDEDDDEMKKETKSLDLERDLEEKESKPDIVASDEAIDGQSDSSIKKDIDEKSSQNGNANKEHEGDTTSIASITSTGEVNEDADIAEEKNKENNKDQPDEKTLSESGENQPETIDVEKIKEGPQPRALHRTSSIFLRNLAPSITKAEIEAVCKNYEGYLRVAIADPLVERRWYRRGWVTFKRDVNIKEICWNLNNTRLRDCEMGAIVNRDLSRRVRPVNGMTAHKTIVRADIKLCAKIALNLDEKFRLWEEENNALGNIPENRTTNGSEGASRTYGFKSNNPVLQNITDFLIEEASAEEDELLGLGRDNKESEGEGIERDPQLVSVLDSLILYLRIVHSVDFYNHCEYPYEDEMPNRCGIIHARGPAPTRISQNDLQDYIKNFETKMQQFLTKTTPIDDEELKNLGSKDTEAEVEKFIQANSQELAKDKWLCPLSGKKFKGPEFIRKHIFNKHLEKVDEVRKEVEYFNNYLKDPKRPQLPEHPGSSSKRTNSESNGGVGAASYRPAAYPPAYAAPYATYAPPMMMPGRGGGRGYGGGRRHGGNYFEHRQFMHYRDLDAPQD